VTTPSATPSANGGGGNGEGQEFHWAAMHRVPHDAYNSTSAHIIMSYRIVYSTGRLRNTQRSTRKYTRGQSWRYEYGQYCAVRYMDRRKDSHTARYASAIQLFVVSSRYPPLHATTEAQSLPPLNHEILTRLSAIVAVHLVRLTDRCLTAGSRPRTHNHLP
jgi:hypothetical protein